MRVLDLRTGKRSEMEQEIITITNWVINLCKKKSKNKYYNFYGLNVNVGFIRSIWAISFKTDFHNSEVCEFKFEDCNGCKYSVDYDTKYSFICISKI